jgi:hypothetical protein
LSQRLDLLERSGVLTRTVHSTIPPKTSYELTEAGRGLSSVIEAIDAWSERFGGGSGPAGTPQPPAPCLARFQMRISGRPNPCGGRRPRRAEPEPAGGWGNRPDDFATGRPRPRSGTPPGDPAARPAAGGTSRAHSSVAKGQRVRKRQPGGRRDRARRIALEQAARPAAVAGRPRAPRPGSACV